MVDPKKKKYRDFRARDRGGRSEGRTGFKQTENYAMGVGPRVGGQATGGSNLKSASRNQIKRAAKLRKKLGTGRGVGRAARATY